jgi:hypothetical protein
MKETVQDPEKAKLPLDGNMQRASTETYNNGEIKEGGVDQSYVDQGLDLEVVKVNKLELVSANRAGPDTDSEPEEQNNGVEEELVLEDADSAGNENELDGEVKKSSARN